MEELISDHEKNYIIGGAQKGLRNDGRSLKDYRAITVETGILSSSNGSARVQIGATDVIVSVKAEMTTVERGDPIVNRFKFFVDISANASPKFAGKGGNELAEEIARALYTAYDSDSVITNLGNLILTPTHFWAIFVDATILQYEGNAVDAISLGIKAALFDTEICNVIVRPADEGKVLIDLPDEVSSWRLDISRAPLLISANYIGRNCVFDADLMEELCSSSTLWIGVQPPPTPIDPTINEDTEEQRITCIKKTRGGSLEIETMNVILENSLAVAAELNAALMMNLKTRMEDENKKISQFSKAFLSY